jgi:septum formation protein
MYENRPHDLPPKRLNDKESSSLVLASASPRRRELLNLAGIKHQVIPSQAEERIKPEESASQFTHRTALEKSMDVGSRVPPGTWVLSADTTVVAQGKILGKPKDLEEGRWMLSLLSGRRHRVMTAVILRQSKNGKQDSILKETEVEFRDITPEMIEGYLSTFEPMDKAGAYGIQGMGALLVRSIKGSYTNVVGLPLCETIEMLQRAGLFQPFGGAG